MNTDPYWPRARDWLGGEPAVATRATLSVLGVPLCVASLSPGRCDRAPSAVREALERAATYDAEFDRDLRVVAAHDCGDLPVSSLRPEEAMEPVVTALGAILGRSPDAVAVLGGDNSVTRPAFLALGRYTPRVGLLTLDAHLDVRHMEAGLNNGNPIRALLADGVPGSSMIQIGIQPFANSREYAAFARESGIRSISLGEARRRGIEATVEWGLGELAQNVDCIYVDTDLDSLDRSLAPGTSGARPGGFTMGELRQALLLCGAHPKVRMIDFVEFDPSRDVAGITAYSAVVALLSFASGLAVRHRGD